MLIIVCGSDIEYTRGDTFDLSVLGEFEENTQLEFVVAENEDSTPIIQNTYQLSENNEFQVTFSSDEREKFSYKNYIYKIKITSPNGDIITQKSGNFKVKWGA